MRCELSFFWDEDDAVEVVETLYHIAACQKEELILEIGGDSYVFPLLYDDRLRLQRIKNIYRKCSKSPKWGKEWRYLAAELNSND